MYIYEHSKSYFIADRIKRGRYLAKYNALPCHKNISLIIRSFYTFNIFTRKRVPKSRKRHSVSRVLVSPSLFIRFFVETRSKRDLGIQIAACV